MNKIVHRDALLQQISDGLWQLEKIPHTKLACIKVTLLEDERVLLECFSVALTLDYLVNDIYFDAYSNWANADRAKVETY